MLSFLKKLFSKEKKIERFSSTTTSAMEGHSAKHLFDPMVHHVIEKIKLQQGIDNKELNLLSAFYFNTPTIEPALYSLNKCFTDGMVFDIENVHVEQDQHGDVSNIYLHMSDVIFENDFKVIVTVKSFDEMFRVLKIHQPQE
jgi:hypothetical protein